MSKSSSKPAPSRPADDKPRSSASVAGWGIAFYGAAQLAGAILDSNPTAATAVQAVIAEWGTGRVGVNWSDPDGPEQNGGTIARRAGLGAALGLASVAAVLGVALAAKLASLAPNTPSYASLGIGLLIACLASARDELMLHGLVLRLTERASITSRLLACGLASAAAAAGSPSTTVPEAIVAGLVGVALGAIWLVDRGAWMAWGAHAAWIFGTGTVARGGLLDVRNAATAWGGGDAGFAGGWAAVAVAGAVAAAGLYTAKRRLRYDGLDARS